MLEDSGNVPVCSQWVRVPQPTSQRGNDGVAAPFAAIGNTLRALACPIASQKDVSEQECESPQRTLVCCPKECLFTSYCQQDLQPMGWFVPGRAPCGIVYPEVHPRVGTLIILERICLQNLPGICAVSCRLGFTPLSNACPPECCGMAQYCFWLTWRVFTLYHGCLPKLSL